jgi:hypothetical protein
VILRGDGEFISWESVKASFEQGYDFIFGNKACNPPFDSSKWYKVKRSDEVGYNECIYQPMGWEQACRFLAMRIPKEEPSGGEPVQIELLEDTKYKYRIFVTNLTRTAHRVIAEYDKRADVENLVGEAKREGLASIPSRKFANNYAYFQIVMLSYNIWRSFKMLAARGSLEQGRQDPQRSVQAEQASKEVIDHTIRIARLKLLFIAAKVTGHSNQNEVKYSHHDSRVSGLFYFMKYLDRCRSQVRPWLENPRWHCKHLSSLGLAPAVLPG